MRSVRAIRYVTPLREGGSLPAIVEADDQRLYVMKFRGAGQGVKALVAELIAATLARGLGLQVPEPVLVELDRVLGRNERDSEIRELLDAARLRALAPDVDVALVQEHLDAVPRICRGRPGAGQLASLGMKERWHWIVAPRSAVVQLSPVHAGLCVEPAEELQRLMRVMVQ